ncbi:U-box domain-containing protein 11-like [Pyrus ussuriensis x Pyrus communis]|uniref:U-box domain-containing protein 11-like n=1 Tax=Pyrus ussuriensis x Pyrus communis TaxID=2448454 RepID=A0A5N5GZU8_9ROSA|nr:U-box domain-containing protein 11-like [Pyrus ussuriensis x Pyrus communis]
MLQRHFSICAFIRATRAGLVTALLKMLTDSIMVDEALTIISVLANHQEAKVTIVKTGTIPNAAAILLALCKRGKESLACIVRRSGMMPLTELARSGTVRAKRKATSLLEHLQKVQQL